LNGATLFTYIASSPDLLIKPGPAAFGVVFGLNAVGVIGAIRSTGSWCAGRPMVLARASLIALIAVP
jgi:hypothetical protein